MRLDPRALLARYHLSPRKSLGQNFLMDTAALTRIVDLASPQRTDTVLEIGAGLGSLTAALAARAGHILAVETDPHLVAVLGKELAPLENVTIIHGDILRLDPATLLQMPSAYEQPLWGRRLSHYQVVANLPYYITGAILRHILEAPVRPATMVVTVQREVAQRILAFPGRMSVLAVGVQFYGKPRLGFRLKRGAFYPPPKVESVVLHIALHSSPPVPVNDIPHFFRTVRAGFAQKRKQLHNTLASTLGIPSTTIKAALAEADVEPTRRAETLSLEEWARVSNTLRVLEIP